MAPLSPGGSIRLPQYRTPLQPYRCTPSDPRAPHTKMPRRRKHRKSAPRARGTKTATAVQATVQVTAAEARDLPDEVTLAVESAREFDDPFESRLEVTLPVPPVPPPDEPRPWRGGWTLPVMAESGPPSNSVRRLVAAKAFEGNEHLTTLIVPEGVDGIGARAFAGCPNLEEVTLPASLVWTAGAVFDDCPRLTRVVGRPAQLPFLAGNFRRSPGATLHTNATVTTLSGDQFALELELPLSLCENENPRKAAGIKSRRGTDVEGHTRNHGAAAVFDGAPDSLVDEHVRPQAALDLNKLLAEQHPGTDLVDPTRFRLLAPVLGPGAGELVPLSPLSAGAGTIAGLQLLSQGGLDLDRIVAVFIEP